MSSRPARGPPRRLLAAVGFTLLVALVVVPSALAHATFVRSDPEDGSSVTRSPPTIRIWFSEGIVPRFSGAKILSERGRDVRLTSVRADADGLLVLTPASKLDRGLYTVDWDVLSAEDGHLRRGFVVFTVARAPLRPLRAIAGMSPSRRSTLRSAGSTSAF